jgi:hypothetical protein
LKLEMATKNRVHAVVHSLSALTALAALAAIAAVTGCGSNSDRGAGDAFVGTWSCPQLPAGAQTLLIGEEQDNSLSLSDDSDAGSFLCQSDLWTYSGSTATMKAGTSCLGGADGRSVITIQNFLLQRSGSSLIVNVTEAVEASDKTMKTVTLVASCSKG